MYDKIYYINLDSRTDRRDIFERDVVGNLPSIQSKFKRVSAVNMTQHKLISQRAAGCSLSHLSIWEHIIKNNIDSVIILEDDFSLIVDEETFNNRISRLYEDYPNFGVCNIGWRNMQPLKRIDELFSYDGSIQTTSGYIISKAYATKMIDDLRNSISRLVVGEPTHLHAIDMVWKKYQHTTDWLVMNKLGIQRESFSDIEGRDANYGV